MKSIERKSAFTLVELSIVLVIIALLVAAAIAGKSLIKSSQLRSLITQIHEIEIATSAFIDRYNAIPGDMSNASDVFGITNCPVSPCNGDGSNKVEFNGTNNINLEVYNYFKHLYLANLLDTKYDGTNIPKVRYGNANMSIRYINGTGGQRIFLRGPAHMMEIGQIGGAGAANGANLANRLAYTAQEVYTLDVKMDDGIATKGNIYAVNTDDMYAVVDNTPNGIGCAGYNTSGSDYALQAQTRTCIIVYWMRAI